MQICGNGSGPVPGTGISVTVLLEVPQLPNALAPLVQAGDDPPRDMTDARCCVEVSQVNMSPSRISEKDTDPSIVLHISAAQCKVCILVRVGA